MMPSVNQYKGQDWFSFRANAIKIADGRCERCTRSIGDGVILQVHHKAYVRGKKPWDYEPQQCEVLCKGCHAKEHGKIQPTSDWVLVGEDDLGELSGICDNCGTEIRYVFFIENPKWNSMAVGTDCCDYLTESTQATELRRLIERKKRFLNSKRWKCTPRQSSAIVQNGILIEIGKSSNEFQIFANKIAGKERYPTEIDARIVVFNLMEQGTIQAFLDRKKARRSR